MDIQQFQQNLVQKILMINKTGERDGRPKLTFTKLNESPMNRKLVNSLVCTGLKKAEAQRVVTAIFMEVHQTLHPHETEHEKKGSGVVAVVLDSTNIGQAKAHIAVALANNAAGRA